MFWVLMFGGIGLAGLVVLIGYVVWLSHKASDVFAELGVVFERLGQLSELLAQIRMPDPAAAYAVVDVDAGDAVVSRPSNPLRRSEPVTTT